MSFQAPKCAVSGCSEPRWRGKTYCLEHHKEYEGKFGLDAELQKKKDAKWNPQLASEAMQWLEHLSGVPSRGMDFHSYLKSGVVLCKALNKIAPGSVSRINTGSAPFVQRENLVAYLEGCKKLGMTQAQLFVSQDIFEGDNLPLVVDQVHALGGLCQKKNVNVPKLGVKVADKATRNFSEAQLRQAEAIPSRQNVGSYGYADTTPQVKVGKIIHNVTGHEASSIPSKFNLGSAPVFEGRAKQGIDNAGIIKNPELFQQGRGKPTASSPAAHQGAVSAGKFCTSCGSQVPPNAKFCGGCGNKM